MASTDPWGGLRALRSGRPGFAADDPDRGDVFDAALEQCEQLLRGAADLGYASRPLNLFYGLSQAGRAITAAWSPPQFGPQNSWRLAGHGITAAPLDRDPHELTVHATGKVLPNAGPRPLPSFTAVARTLGSHNLQRPVKFVDLWAYLPEAADRPPPGDNNRWGPLRLEPSTQISEAPYTTNRWGTTYVYYFCLGRQQRRTSCVQRAVSVELIEDKIEQLWDTVRVSPEYVRLLDGLIRDELAVYREQAEKTRASATRRLQLLQGRRRSLLDAHYAGAIPIELLKSEQDRLTEEVAACERRLATAGVTSEAIERNLEQCLQFIRDAATTYRTASARIRRRMNQSLFERILVEEDGTVVGQLVGPYRQLLDPNLVIPASKLTAEPEAADEPGEPQQEVVFDPKAWSLGVPAWMFGQVAWQRKRTKKPLASGDVRGSSRGPGRDLSSAWVLKKTHVVHLLGQLSNPERA